MFENVHPFGDLPGLCRFIMVYYTVHICLYMKGQFVLLNNDLIDSAAGVDALGLCLPATITVLRLCHGKSLFGEQTKQTHANTLKFEH